MSEMSPETWAKAAALLVSAFGVIEAVIWFGLWRDEKRYVYISRDTERHCWRQFLQSLVFAVVGAVGYALAHYYERLL